MTTWQQQFFAEDYLTLFGPYVEGERAEAETARFAGLLELDPGARVLDLACGQGRHAVGLRAAGHDVVGLDLSAVLLRAAADRDPGLRLLRADMRRLPLAGGCVDGVLNLFNAFGYFDHDGEDLAVLQEVRRVLRPGGRFVQEVHHRDALVRDWEPRTVHPTYGDGLVLTEERDWDSLRGRHAVRYTLQPGDGGPARGLEHVLRVYTLTELVALHERAGLEVLEVQGDDATVRPGMSVPLCVVVSRRPA